MEHLNLTPLGRCGTCGQWQRNSRDFDVGNNAKHAGTCNSGKYVYEDVAPQDGLRYWDYEGYSAGFETGEYFGCVHWDRALRSNLCKHD